jgi:RNA polymerase sigma-70 factor (ECF subfamily)
MNEAQLLRKACQGDGPAVRALYERYSPRVYAVVRRIAADDDLAQDYAQGAWIRAIRALPTFRGEARFSTWLHRIAVNSALQAVRTAETRHKREAPMPESLAVAVPERDALLSKKLEWALDHLPERMRKGLILHDVEGYTHDEIGELLGTTVGTSKSQLFKARGKMRVLLKHLDSSEKPGAADDRKELEAWSI